jgi:hypothetical protein
MCSLTAFIRLVPRFVVDHGLDDEQACARRAARQDAQ